MDCHAALDEDALSYLLSRRCKTCTQERYHRQALSQQN